MKIFFPRLIALSLIFFALPNAPVGAQNSTEQAPPVFKAETRQVLVDVVVTDHNGHFVPGLKPADFAVLEDGKPQKVVAFAMHAAPAVPPKPAAPIKLPPNQYTNYAIADHDRADGRTEYSSPRPGVHPQADDRVSERAAAGTAGGAVCTGNTAENDPRLHGRFGHTGGRS